ncbi:MAG: TRAP transporter small permease [Enterocloster sp.]
MDRGNTGCVHCMGVFAAGGAAYRTGNHSAIEILYEIFPKPVRKIVSIFIGLVVTAVLGFLCYTSIGYLQLFMRTGRTTAVLNLPFTWLYDCTGFLYASDI